MENHWAVVIKGNALDLKNALLLFERGGVGGVRLGTIELSGGRVLPALFASSFGAECRSEDVQEEASRLLDLINGILFVTDPGRELLSIWSVHPRTAHGWGPGYAFMAGSAKGRSHLSGSLDGGAVCERVEPLWVDLAVSHPEVRDVLLFLRTPEPDWFDLFKASELIESAKAKSWWPERQFALLTCSAQFARHARGTYEGLSPEQRMRLGEARRLVAELARRWLGWWVENEVEARAAMDDRVRAMRHGKRPSGRPRRVP